MIDTASASGTLSKCTNYYRANHLNPPFNDTHPRSEVARSFSAKVVTEGAKSIVATMPTLIGGRRHTYRRATHYDQTQPVFTLRGPTYSQNKIGKYKPGNLKKNYSLTRPDANREYHTVDFSLSPSITQYASAHAARQPRRTWRRNTAAPGIKVRTRRRDNALPMRYNAVILSTALFESIRRG